MWRRKQKRVALTAVKLKKRWQVQFTLNSLYMHPRQPRQIWHHDAAAFTALIHNGRCHDHFTEN